MVGRVGAEGQADIVGLFHFLQVTPVLVAEAVEIDRVEQDAEGKFAFGVFPLRAEAAGEADEAALDFHAHGAGIFHDAATVAVRAGGVDAGGVGLGLPLAGHLQDAQLGDREYLAFGAVFFHLDPQRLVNLFAVLGVFHVDGVDDDQPAEIAESDLPGDRKSVV